MPHKVAGHRASVMTHARPGRTDRVHRDTGSWHIHLGNGTTVKLPRVQGMPRKVALTGRTPLKPSKAVGPTGPER